MCQVPFLFADNDKKYLTISKKGIILLCINLYDKTYKKTLMRKKQGEVL